MKPVIRLALLAAMTAAVACADDKSPTAALDFSSKEGINTGARGEYAIRGVVLRYAGAGDSIGDTLGTLLPEVGALVEAWRVGDAPDDTIPGDSVPRDSVPRDSVPHDSVPGDTMLTSSFAARGALAVRPRFAATSDSAVDTTSHGGGQRPVMSAVAHTDAQGAFALERLPSGMYRVDVTPRGSAWVYAWTIVIVRDADVDGLRFTLPPAR